MKVIVSKPREGRCLAVASTEAITGERVAFIGGLFYLIVVAMLLSACQQSSSPASSGSSSVQQSQGSDLDTNRERRCCRHASRGSNH